MQERFCEFLKISSFHLYVHLIHVHLILHDLVHHLPHQVGQIELLNVHGQVHYFLIAKVNDLPFVMIL